MSLFFSKIRSVNVIISNMDGFFVMVGWTDCMSQKGHELSGMEKIHDKLIRIGVGHLTSLKQCDMRSFFVSSERSLHDLNDTL
jgi:hypothetical protein